MYICGAKYWPHENGPHSKGINFSIISLCGLGVGMCGLLIGLRKVLPLMFTSEADVIWMASQGIFIMSFMCLFHG